MATSASIDMLRVWVHAATNKGTRQFLSAWWSGADASRPPSASTPSSDTSDDASAPPTPVVIAAICAPDTEDQPLDGSAHHYTSYDSDDGGGDSCNDAAAHLELLKQLGTIRSPPASGSSSRALYTMYTSQKSGSAA